MQTLGFKIVSEEGGKSAYFCIKHVDTEVTKCSLKKVILGTVFQQCAIHGVGSNLTNDKPNANRRYHY